MTSATLPNHSVVITTADHGILFARCLDSVRTQSHATFDEIVIVDDSRLRSISIDLRSNERIVQGGRNGQSAALNVGLGFASGQYIHLLDGDDQWHENKLTRVSWAFEKHNVDVVCHNLTYYSTDSECITGNVRNGPSCEGPKANLGPTSAMSFSRTALAKIGPIPEDIKICSDQYLISLINILNLKRFYLSESLGRYVLHGQNAFSGKLTQDRINRRMDAFRAIRSALVRLPNSHHLPELCDLTTCRQAIRHLDREITRLSIKSGIPVLALLKELMINRQEKNAIDVLYSIVAETVPLKR